PLQPAPSHESPLASPWWNKPDPRLPGRRARTIPTGEPGSSQMLVEPGKGPLPAIFGGFFAIAGPVVGVEGMGRIGVQHKFRRLGRIAALDQRGLHLLHAL